MLGLYMIQHPEKIGFLSIRDLAKNAGVSIATVSRLCMRLGYSGYDELGREVQQSVQYELSTPARLRLLSSTMPLESAEPADTFERVVDIEIDNLMTMRRAGRPDGLETCVEWINGAASVVVVGTMGSTALAEYLSYAISKVRSQVRPVTTAMGTDAWLQLHDVGPDCVVFLIGFPRYQRSTVELGQHLKRKGCRIVAITDHYKSPLAATADIVFPISVSFSTIVDSFAAPVAFIHALVAAYGEKYRAEVQEHLLEFERYTAEMRIWSKSPPED